MRVLLSWLRQFAPLEGDPTELGDQMSDLGMAVEEQVPVGAALDGIVVARVLSLRRHPDADRIQLVDVDAGDGEALQIACGAFNMAEGDLVPLATLGTVMPGGMKIERRKMRGEWSNGMLCSAAEIGFGDDHEGIWLLGPEATPGATLAEAVGLAADDVLYDLEINPNRPDAMSVAGVARDLAARVGAPFSLPPPAVVEVGADAVGRISVDLVDPDLCGRFLARALDDVAVGPSPAWLATRLRLLGMRPINNVVDVSNYVMLELGQPNHTYDLAKVPGGALRVRWARDGETIVTLDDVERTLGPGDGVIADGDDGAIGIAGVMGGASTEIGPETSSVLLEMAWWDPMTIARSSKRLQLRSEASARFERGCDPEVVELAALRFAELLGASGAVLAPGSVDVRGNLPSTAPIVVRTPRVNDLLTTSFTDADVRALLEPIGFGFPEQLGDGAGAQPVVIPTFRYDTRTETDVVEEVARHHGYRRISGRLPVMAATGGLTERQRDRRLVREVLVGLGLDEAMPVPFLAPGDLEAAEVDTDAVSVTNPLVADESVLRTSLRPGLLKAVAYNESHRNEGVALFELQRTFRRPADGERLPDEREELGVVLAGASAPEAVDVWRVLASSLGLADWSLDQRELAGLHPTRAAAVVVGAGADGVAVGAVGEIDPAVAERFSVAERCAWLELDLDALLSLPRSDGRLRPVSRYPSSDIDLAFAVADSAAAADVEATIRSAAGDLLVSLVLFDVYRGEGVDAGFRSLAYRLRLQADDRTLTDTEVGELRAGVIDAVQAALPATLRA